MPEAGAEGGSVQALDLGVAEDDVALKVVDIKQSDSGEVYKDRKRVGTKAECEPD